MPKPIQSGATRATLQSKLANDQPRRRGGDVGCASKLVQAAVGAHFKRDDLAYGCRQDKEPVSTPVGCNIGWVSPVIPVV